MKPILPGERGSAVEDVQRRLHALGYDLGPTGVDGVFFGMTRDAVVAFQRQRELSEDGIVGDETWSALVDAGFTLGDRVLYLRLPYFHGNDVSVLQEALGALGFAAAGVDGIFGPTTDKAVREFQRNSGHSVDGIVGAETVQLIDRLRHVWEGRGTSAVLRHQVGAAETGPVFARTSLALVACDSVSRGVAERIVNVALAMDPAARVMLAEEGGESDFTVHIATRAPSSITGSLVSAGDDGVEALTGRLVTAFAASDVAGCAITVELGPIDTDDQGLQRVSVRMFDALCVALAR